jgi:hypothetical protein
MAVVVVAKIDGGTQEFYDQVTAKIMPGGEQLPEGGKVHIAGPTEGGWRVITVWDSEDQFHQFRNEKLIPAIREVAGEGGVAPNITADPVYRLVTA